MMAIQNQSLHDEHHDLYQQLDALRTLADAIGAIPQGEVMQRLDAVLAFLTGHLLVQAQAEDQVLYPAMARVLGASAAKTTVDHIAIRRMTGALQTARQGMETRQITNEDEQNLRRLLYSLYTLASLHLAQEDEVFWPALDVTLSPGAVQELTETLDRTKQDHASERND